MKTMMLLYDGPEFLDLPEAKANEIRGAWVAYVGMLGAAGLLVDGAELHGPSAAKTIRLDGDEPLVQDGPFVEAKEGLGGYIVIDVPSMAVAIEWATRAPKLPGGGIELRPLVEEPASEQM